MRAAKQYLVREVEGYLEDPQYLFLADYQRVNVEDVTALKKDLRKKNAQYHVVKKSILNLVAKKKGLPDISRFLQGQISLVAGGRNPSEVAKILLQFSKEKEKLVVRGGILDGKSIDANDIQALSRLPSIEVLRAQFLGLLITPLQQFVTVLQGVPRGLLNVLQARSEQV
jgi:large subunit ribosomal protein L10